ncbi:hypothetical protein TWF788_006939 [Orbilia oligospora]|uniref:Uncharacterized protein n=1 Tax=Orbilia oligospora TaxID=2813651 RepID=A0A7C8PUB0_ORBOL|nr:hypothetical protein TWF788_006939 [Orbilia oligospora]
MERFPTEERKKIYRASAAADKWDVSASGLRVLDVKIDGDDDGWEDGWKDDDDDDDGDKEEKEKEEKAWFGKRREGEREE